MAQSAMLLNLDFGSDHDLRVVRLSPTSGSIFGVEPASYSLSSFAFAFPPVPSLFSKKKKKR